MQWSTSSGKDGIIQRATFLAFGDSNDHTASWPLADMTSSGNRAVQKISLKIWAANSMWEIDDLNQTDLPSALTTLVNAQNDYSLPTGIFKVERVEVLDNGSNWHVLVPRELREIPQAIPMYFQTAGLPKEYWIKGNSLWLFPAPDNGLSVTLASGLRIYFTRKFTTFSVPASYTTADTTNPGFDEQFHDTVAKIMAQDWCLVNGPADRLKNISDSITADFLDLQQHYGVKWRDKRTSVKPTREIYL